MLPTLCVIDIRTEIHMPRSDRFLITAAKQKAEDTFRMAAILLSFHILQSITFTEAVNVSKVYNQISFQDV